MEILHIAPYKVLHLEYNEVKVLARLQKAIGESHTLMCCCFCRKLTLYLVPEWHRSHQHLPSCRLPPCFCESDCSVIRGTALLPPVYLCSTYSCCPCAATPCNGFMTKSLISHSGSDTFVCAEGSLRSAPGSLLTNV